MANHLFRLLRSPHHYKHRDIDAGSAKRAAFVGARYSKAIHSHSLKLDRQPSRFASICESFDHCQDSGMGTYQALEPGDVLADCLQIDDQATGSHRFHNLAGDPGNSHIPGALNEDGIAPLQAGQQDTLDLFGSRTRQYAAAGRGRGEGAGSCSRNMFSNQDDSIYAALGSELSDTRMLFDFMRSELSHPTKNEYLPPSVLLERSQCFQR